MNKNIIIGIVVIVVLVAGGVYWFVQGQAGGNGVPPYGASSTVPTPQGSAPQSGSLSATTTSPTPVPVQTSPQAATPTTHNITIKNFAFSPASITVKKGDTIVWINNDTMGHTVTGNNGGPASPTITINGAYSFTFNDVGTFPYHCAIHPSMTGTVTVTP